MKIQSLAVIFVLIILPISIVLSEYVHVQINTLNIQTQYDSQLLSATYDAVVAFQKNTVNSRTSDIATSKMRDIEASVNTFFTSVANNFKMSGSSKDAIKEYIPAIVYTLYDGYYIYTPFTNTLGDDIQVISDSTYQNGERTFGLKPYIYYSREYKIDSENDFIITYSLDNYITIQGKVRNKIINDSGYIIDITGLTDSYDGSTYKGVNIKEDDKVFEYVDDNRDSNNLYQCVKVNGTKYYLDGDSVFYFILDNRQDLTYGVSQEYINKYFNNNTLTREYYRKAYEFTKRALDEYGLRNLQSSNGNYIFKVENIEYYNSGFNQERREVIKSSIEKNLSSAIANFNNITQSPTSATTNFQMPILSDDEWDKIINNVSVITFLQGLNMGTRQYNGYAIIPNNKNEESVGEDSIYITTADGEYHRVNDKDLLENGTVLKQGIFNMNFERKSITDEEGRTTKYFYPNTERACYNSVVAQTKVDPMLKDNGIPMSIYEYLDSIKGKTNGSELASLYYTALGR